MSHSENPAVQLGAVQKSFGNQEVIAPLDLTVFPGEFVSLVGASGCGKTTLLRMMAGLEDPTDGRVSVHGKSPREACAQHWIGVAFQRPALLPSKTALQNVELTLTITGHRPRQGARALLEQFGLGAAADRYPHQLSGGMQQRVNIASALVHEPRVLLLDEPFGALDELTRESVVDWLAGVLKESGRTAILVTHSLEEAVTLSDRILVMERHPGRIGAEIPVELERPRGRALRQGDAYGRMVQTARRSLYAVLEEES
jgi:NitT/TauT family transport system ATP-binding protein